MRVQHVVSLPRMGSLGLLDAKRRTETVEKYLERLASALEVTLTQVANAVNVNEHGALLVQVGETMPTASASLIGMFIHERRSGAADRLWWCRYDAAGAPELVEVNHTP